MGISGFGGRFIDAGANLVSGAAGAAASAAGAAASAAGSATEAALRLTGFAPGKVVKGPGGTTFEGAAGRGSSAPSLRLDPSGSVHVRTPAARGAPGGERPLSLAERSDLLGALARFARDPRSDPEIQRLITALRDPRPLPKPAESADAKKDVLCPVLGSMIKEGKIKLDADGNMDLKAFNAMLQRDMHMSAPLAAATAGVGPLANRPQDILGNIVGARMNPLELRTGNVHHEADSMILTSGKFDEAKFQDLARHANDAKVVNGKVVGGTLTLADFGDYVKANVRRDRALSGYLEGIPSGVAEFAALTSMFGKLNPRTGQREISVETVRALYQDKKLPPPAGTAADPSTLRDFLSDAAVITRNLPGVSPSGTAREGARLAAGVDGSASQAAMLGLGRGVCPHMQGASATAAPLNAAEVRAVGSRTR